MLLWADEHREGLHGVLPWIDRWSKGDRLAAIDSPVPDWEGHSGVGSSSRASFS
jgi:hypothetical protein